MVGWHHWLKGHEFEQASWDGEGQGSLLCYSPWGHKESDMTEWLNNNMFFSRARGAFSRIGHILDNILSLSNFKKSEIISKTISNHNTMRLNITTRKKLKNTNTWRLNNILLKKPMDHWRKQKVHRNKWKWKHKHDDPKLWNAAKAVLRRKFIAIRSYLRKQEISQINNLSLYLKQLEKEEQTKAKASGRKEIKIRAEINGIMIKKTTEKINKIKSWFFKKTSKIDKPLTRLIKEKKKGRGIKSIKFWNGKGEFTIDTTKMYRIVRDYYKQLYFNKIDNIEEMDKFLKRYTLPSLKQKN